MTPESPNAYQDAPDYPGNPPVAESDLVPAGYHVVAIEELAVELTRRVLRFGARLAPHDLRAAYTTALMDWAAEEIQRLPQPTDGGRRTIHVRVDNLIVEAWVQVVRTTVAAIMRCDMTSVQLRATLGPLTVERLLEWETRLGPFEHLLWCTRTTARMSRLPGLNRRGPHAPYFHNPHRPQYPILQN